MNAATSEGAALPAEEQARANCYAVIGRLLYAAPDASIRDYVRRAGSIGDSGPLAEAWDHLQATVADAPEAEARLEYDDLFVSVGKAPVTLYTSAYAAPHAPDRHLVALRARLDTFGLARTRNAGEPEDHIAAICDVMRWLIETGQGMGAEQFFFSTCLAPAVEPLCNAINACPGARVYRAVAAFFLQFYDVERAAFELTEP